MGNIISPTSTTTVKTIANINTNALTLFTGVMAMLPMRNLDSPTKKLLFLSFLVSYLLMHVFALTIKVISEVEHALPSTCFILFLVLSELVLAVVALAIRMALFIFE
ncbi:hypothetical protein QJS04_geneDACA014929 [Acorus gramineus]|uniref:NADH dehydrogenase subunit 4L n=1 Tax=Acorus gramineus TaxID=55184 RepID=A0AAV9BWC2_ACOGR|nr:hypothetical protein QJS04_geneDACA014929 [Acorus gramineus]